MEISNKKMKGSTTKSKYHDYLKTPEWLDKRERVKKRDGYCCAICSSKFNLHVHHKHYANIYNEQLNDLVTLCQDCHGRFHDKIQPPKIPQDNSQSTTPNKGVKKWGRKKFLNNRAYADKAIDCRALILSQHRPRSQIKITKKILQLCLTFGFGVHGEAEYFLLKKNNLRKRSGWQKRLKRKFISFKDLAHLFEYTEQREANQLGLTHKS